jgi:hypothetical protein
MNGLAYITNCLHFESKSNVEELEQMIRDGGEDPGLHYHSDLSNYDLFSELRKEMADVIQNEEEVLDLHRHHESFVLILLHWILTDGGNYSLTTL